jgi:dTDP-glucose pyrophosphorylase/CBS domain-containing protein
MKPWQNALVGPNVPLEVAIDILDKAGLRIALVVDEDLRLLGTLTDGDVRRVLLRHQSLDLQVSRVMNLKPKVSGLDWPNSKVLATMEAFQLLHLPRVDDSGKLVGLDDIHDLLDLRRHANPVFLMAGGFGTRLRPLTENCPKPMLLVGGKPILEQILIRFVDAGFHRFYISTHYLPEVIRDYFADGSKWGVSIQYIHEKEPLGTGGALGLLPRDEIDLPLFVMNGDLLTSINFHSLLEFHNSHEGPATMCVREYEHQVPYGVITTEGNRIKTMVEKPVHKFFINAGIYVLSPELVKSVGSGVRIDMPSLLEHEMQGGRIVNTFPLHEHWIDVGRMEDFDMAQSQT